LYIVLRNFFVLCTFYFVPAFFLSTFHLLLVTAFQLTPELVFLVPVEIAPFLQGFLQGFAGTVEPYFDVVDGKAEDIGNLGTGKTFEVLKDQRDSVFLRKTVDEAAYSRVHLPTDGDVIQGAGSGTGFPKHDRKFPIVRRFGDRIGPVGRTPEPVPGDVGRDAVDPGRKGGFAAEPVESAADPDHGLLGQVLGVVLPYHPYKVPVKLRLKLRVDLPEVRFHVQ